MSEVFSTALMLMAVGMITVFLILLFIVVFGNLLISFVNRFFPESKIPAVAQPAIQSGVDPRKLAAIISAVDVITEGRARVTSIEKTA